MIQKGIAIDYTSQESLQGSFSDFGEQRVSYEEDIAENKFTLSALGMGHPLANPHMQLFR